MRTSPSRYPSTCPTRTAARAAAVVLLVVCAVFMTALLPQAPRADEGMWLPFMLDKCPVDSWHSRGLELSPEDIYDAKKPSVCDAIIQLGGGTASFVSFDGLIATNHHVAFGALQRTSSVGSDYIKDGFLAADMSAEIPAPGYEAKVLLDVEDVTEKVLKAVKKDMTDLERYKAIETANKKIVAKAEKDKDVYCEVRSFYGGSDYYLYTYFKLKDIRIVYAPPQSIGEFGGDVDNWIWPRHTGDFSFMRAYVGPNGESAEFSEANVPYHPKKYLTISKAPLKEGDFTMVIGYPGRTSRYRTSYAIAFSADKYYPVAIETYKDIIAILEEEAKRGRMVEIKLAGLNKGLNNGLKNNEGMLEGLLKSHLVSQKVEEENQLKKYLAANPDLQKKYGTVLDDIKSQYDDYASYWEQSRILGMVGYVSATMRSAMAIYKWGVELEKKDMDRDPGYQERDEASVRKRLDLFELSYDEQTDKRILKYFLLKLAKSDQTCGSIEGITPELTEADLDAMLDNMYAGTKITDKDERMKMFGKTKKELLALNDPFIAFAAKAHVQREKLEERSDAFEGALQELRPKLMELRTKYRGGLLYPDANSTMRVSVGQIKGYSPADAVQYHWMTTLDGVIAKTTGEKPFDTPQKLIDLKAAGDFGGYADPVTGDVPVCFVSTDDVTGGSSGSPILNGKGEMIGLVFDGNYEAISADYQFIPKLTRTICVDSRYVLFVLDKFAGANSVLDELKITGGTGPLGSR